MEGWEEESNQPFSYGPFLPLKKVVEGAHNALAMLASKGTKILHTYLACRNY